MPKSTGLEEGLADRLVGLSERARAVGRTAQADHFLLLAWAAFEGGQLPAWRCVSQRGQTKPSR